MTTPIERAARSIHSMGCADELYGGACTHNPTKLHSRESLEAVLVFESIDRDELADVIYPKIRLSPDHRPSEMVRALHAADAIITYLLGDQS